MTSEAGDGQHRRVRGDGKRGGEKTNRRQGRAREKRRWDEDGWSGDGQGKIKRERERERGR